MRASTLGNRRAELFTEPRSHTPADGAGCVRLAALAPRRRRGCTAAAATRSASCLASSCLSLRPRALQRRAAAPPAPPEQVPAVPRSAEDEPPGQRDMRARATAPDRRAHEASKRRAGEHRRILWLPRLAQAQCVWAPNASSSSLRRRGLGDISQLGREQLVRRRASNRIGTSASSDLMLPARRCRLALAKRQVLRVRCAAQVQHVGPDDDPEDLGAGSRDVVERGRAGEGLEVVVDDGLAESARGGR